jgi:aryl-alcohol dehydrogenase-like predicted oxidoreductase
VGDGAWGEPAAPAEAHRVLRRAVELGVTLIDTADAYGPEIAERLIAEALYPYPADLLITTKGGNTRPGPARAEPVGRAGYLIQCVEMSLRRLKLERIDLYQLHRIDPRTPLEESLGALKRMQEQGKIGHIGLSEVTVAEIEEARKIVPIVTVQNRYSLADRRHEETLAWCEQQGIGFLPWYPIAAGKLLKADQPAGQALAQVAAHSSATAAQLSLAWLLRRNGPRWIAASAHERRNPVGRSQLARSLTAVSLALKFVMSFSASARVHRRLRALKMRPASRSA